MNSKIDKFSVQKKSIENKISRPYFLQYRQDNSLSHLNEKDIKKISKIKKTFLKKYPSTNGNYTHLFMNGGKLLIPEEKLTSFLETIKENKINPPIVEKIFSYNQFSKFFVDIDDKRVNLDLIIKEINKFIKLIFEFKNDLQYTIWKNQDFDYKYHIIWNFKLTKVDIMNLKSFFVDNNINVDVKPFSTGLRLPFCIKNNSEIGKPSSIYKFHSGFFDKFENCGSISNTSLCSYPEKTQDYIEYLDQMVINERENTIFYNHEDPIVNDLIRQIIEIIPNKIRNVKDNGDGTYYIELFKTGCSCFLNEDVTHKNNNQYIILDKHCYYFIYKCHSKKCDGLKKEFKLKINHPLELNMKTIRSFIQDKVYTSEEISFVLKRIQKYINNFLFKIYGLEQDLYLIIEYTENGKRDIIRKKSLLSFLRSKRFYIKTRGYVMGEEQIIKKKFNLHDLFEDDQNRLDYKYIVCEPLQIKLNKKDFNIFDGFEINKNLSVNENIDPFLNHIKTIWCKNNNEKYDYVLNWFAHCLQKPHLKTRVALTLMSKPGAGKGIIVQKFKEIYGEKNFIQIVSYDKITGNFNHFMEGKFMIFLDEAVWGGNRKDIGSLKALITEPKILINKKGISQYELNSYSNVIIASNEKWVVPAGQNSRRYFVLNLDNKYSGIQKKESTQYFNKILKIDPKAIAYYFYNRDISTFNPARFPENEDLQEQKLMSLNSIESYALAVVNGDIEFEYKDNIIDYEEGEWVPRSVFYSEYKKNTQRNIKNPNIFWKEISKIFTNFNDKHCRKIVRGFGLIFVEKKSIRRRMWVGYFGKWNWKI